MSKRTSNKKVKQMVVSVYKGWEGASIRDCLNSRYQMCIMEITHDSVSDYFDTVNPPLSLTAEQMK